MSSRRPPSSTSLEAVAKTTFELLDDGRKGYLTFQDLVSGFRQRRLVFSEVTFGELFYKADLNKDDRIQLKEWINWGWIYPNLLQVLHYRSFDSREEALAKQALKDPSSQKDRAGLKKSLAAATQRRLQIQDNEMMLIEQEIRMERTHDAVRIQELKWAETETAFNAVCSKAGSPRRAFPLGPPTPEPSNDSSAIASDALRSILEKSASPAVLGKTIRSLAKLLRPSERVLRNEPHSDVTSLVKDALMNQSHGSDSTSPQSHSRRNLSSTNMM
eukprot:TRINITY_DN11129_c0_g3_i1.p1 TRINITY_DN11129_c0_g3~~TRINITY_DN11129_c0_g3_i1.p1  ORF type:complete len:273 (+),score=27.43 TRINITY_DN11129_c0_g3_i1:48-866(+)